MSLLRIGPLNSLADAIQAIRDIEAFVDSPGWVRTIQIASGAVTSDAVDPDLLAGLGGGGVPVYSSLPPLPDASIKEVIYLSSDGKLYRKTPDGAAWEYRIPTVDLVGQIANAQIVDAAITEVKIATDAITTTKIANDAISTPKLAALVVDASKIAANAVTASKINALAVTTAALDAGAVTTAKLAAGAVTANELAANSVVAGKIAAAAIAASNIQAGAITAAQIAAGTITAAEIASGTITTSLIAANAITSGLIAAGAVTAAKLSVGSLSAITADMGILTSGLIRDAASKFNLDLTNRLVTVVDEQAVPVTRVKFGKLDATAAGWGLEVRDQNDSIILSATGLGTNVVSTAQIANGAVTGSKIQNGTLTTALFASGIAPVELLSALPAATGSGRVVFNTTDNTLYRDDAGPPAAWVAVVSSVNLADNAVTTAKLAAAAVTTAKLANDAVTSAIIAAGAVTSTRIADDSISTPKLQAGAITTVKIAASAVTTNEIAANTIQAGNIAAGTITGAKIAALTITASNIAAGTITANELAANSITAGKIAAGAVSASEISVSSLAAISASMGTLTAGVLRDPTASFKLDLDNRLLTILDEQAVPATRVRIGKLNISTTDWGIEVKDQSGNIILTATGLGTNVVGTGQLQNSAVTTSKIAAGAITRSLFPAGETTVELLSSLPTATGSGRVIFNTTDNTLYRDDAAGPSWIPVVSSVALADGSVTSAKLADAAVVVAKIADNAISTAKIAASAVTNAKMANDAVTSAIVAAGAITTTKIADDSISTAKIQAASIVTAKIAAGAVTTNEIAANTIQAGNIAAGTITATEIAAATITGSKIAALTITGGEIAAATITGGKIAANTITASNIAAGTITAAQIAASTITSNELAANAVVAGKIAAGSVDASKISVSSLSAISANVGTLTAGLMQDSGGTRGIRLGTSAKPGGWTSYIDLAPATSVDYLVNFLSKFTINRQGDVGLTGSVTIASAGSLNVNGPATFDGTTNMRGGAQSAGGTAAYNESGTKRIMSDSTGSQTLRVLDSGTEGVKGVWGDYSMTKGSLTAQVSEGASWNVTSSAVNADSSSANVWLSGGTATAPQNTLAAGNLPAYDGNYKIEARLTVALGGTVGLTDSVQGRIRAYYQRSTDGTSWVDAGIVATGLKAGSGSSTTNYTATINVPGTFTSLKIALVPEVNFTPDGPSSATATVTSDVSDVTWDQVRWSKSSGTTLTRRGAFFGKETAKPHFSMEPMSSAEIPVPAYLAEGEVLYDGTKHAIAVFDGQQLNYLSNVVPTRYTADASAITSTTGAALPTLQLDMVAGEEWFVEWIIDLTFSTTTATLVSKLSVLGGTATGTWTIQGSNGVPTTNTAPRYHTIPNIGTTSQTGTIGATGAAANVLCIIVRGRVKCTGSGTLQLLLGSSAGNITPKAGSQFTFTRIA